MCTLVGGKTTCETDNQSIGIDFFHNLHYGCGIALVGKPFFFEIAFYKVDELVLKSHSHIPDCGVVYIEDTFPSLRIALVVKHLTAEMLHIECFPFRGSPGRHVYAIGHISYMAFFP